MTADFRAQLQSGLGAAFVLERELGGGGMSRVFVATETALSRRVVIKTVPKDMLSGSAAERFRREILTVARLQHPNIVPVLSAGNADGVPWFSMPLVDGASLREQLQRAPMALPTAISVLRDVARALAAAHASGIAHRDIKPENILLSRGAAVVTDFGVAKALAEATSAGEDRAGLTGVGMSIGTPSYMAPEQLAADPSLDHRADLYAWGLVAYEVLSGRRAFEGLSGSALMSAQLGTMPTDVAQVAPNLPPALAALVMHCLAKDPSARPATADTVLAVLDSISGIAATRVGAPSGAGSAATQLPSSRTTSRTISRNQIAIAGVALLIVALGAFWLRDRSTRTEADSRSIAIAPFRVGGAAPAVRYLREGIADLMVPQLQSIPGVHAPSTRLMFNKWVRAAGAADADLEDAKALRVAADVGAAQLVMGEIVGSAERLTLSARLLRVSDGTVLATSNVVGPADSVGAQVARVTTELLALRDGATRDRLRTVMSAKPEALLAYVTGERAYRAGRYEEAGKAYADAFRADTTFALAALRISATNGWTFTRTIPGDWLAAAWRHRDRLTGNDSLLLLSSTGTTYPQPTPLRARIRFLQQLAEAGRTAELWTVYADVLFHDGEAAAEPNSWARSLEAFQRAEALDSSFAPALEHQSQLHTILGDSVAAQADFTRQARVDASGDFLRLMRVWSANALDPRITALLDSLPADYLAASATLRLSDVRMTGRMSISLSDSLLARAARAGERDPTYAREVFLNTGRPSRIPSFARQSASPQQLAEDILGGLLGDADNEGAARSASALAQWTRDHPSDSLTTTRAIAHFYAGLWAFQQGDTASVERSLKALRALKPSAETPWRRGNSAVFEELLAAHLALARKQADLKSRLQRVDSLLIDTPQQDRRLSRLVGNMLMADLWERAGEPERALAANHRRDGQYGLAMLASSRLLREARLTEELGRPRDAITALRSYVLMREQAEPSQQRELADAKATLARLEAKVR